MSDSHLALEARDITKSFDRNVVLRNFQLDVQPAKVRALLGHNGSGKSTFIRILAGYYSPDHGSGSIYVGGERLEPGNPESARRVGVSFVHQTLGLAPTLSVLDNLQLGRRFITRFGKRIDWKQERQSARSALLRFGLDIDPMTPLEFLSPVEQAGVAIVRALGDEGEGVRLLVLDEPTATMNGVAVQRLFNMVRHVQRRGVGVLYVSHRLEEVADIADDVTVLRDGTIVGEGSTDDFSTSRLIALISGASAGANTAVRLPLGKEHQWVTNAEGSVLSLRGLKAGFLDGLNLEGYAGEILGVVGLTGNGSDDLARVLTGQEILTDGAVLAGGRGWDPSRTYEAVSRRIAFVVADRSQRVIQDMTVQENLSLRAVSRFFRKGFLRRKEEQQFAKNLMAKFKIRPPLPDATMRTLSGGNQQKVAIARAIDESPQVLILEEPSQGVDAGGRQDIASFLRHAAGQGALVLLIDSDLEEVVELCTRVVVLRNGRVAREMRGDLIERGELLRACYEDDASYPQATSQGAQDS
jgi:ribose transport system ATP-binding protein